MAASAPLRFLGSLGVALCVVLVMLWFSLEVTGFSDREPSQALEAHEVSLLTDAERQDLREQLGEGRYGLAPLQAAPGGVEPLDFTRDQRGFVRLDVQVDASGNVEHIRVIDASPPGIYETQAVAELQGRRFAPEIVDGRAVPSRHLEIVDFTVSPAAARGER